MDQEYVKNQFQFEDNTIEPISEGPRIYWMVLVIDQNPHVFKVNSAQKVHTPNSFANMQPQCGYYWVFSHGTTWEHNILLKNRKIAPSCDSYLNILCILFYALYSMHCIILNVFYEMYSMHCILCIVFYASYFMLWITWIVF